MTGIAISGVIIIAISAVLRQLHVMIAIAR